MSFWWAVPTLRNLNSGAEPKHAGTASPNVMPAGNETRLAGTTIKAGSSLIGLGLHPSLLPGILHGPWSSFRPHPTTCGRFFFLVGSAHPKKTSIPARSQGCAKGSANLIPAENESGRNDDQGHFTGSQTALSMPHPGPLTQGRGRGLMKPATAHGLGASPGRPGHLRDVRDIRTSVQNLFQAVLSYDFSTPNH